MLKADCTEITGEVTWVDAKPQWNGWGRAGVELGPGFEITVVGSGVARLVPGATAKITGEVKSDPKWGQQFTYKDSEISLPSSKSAYVRWLAARVPLIGPVLSGRLWDAFGEGIWDVVLKSPEQILDVKGIGDAAQKSLIESYMLWLADVELYTKLSDFGFPEWLLLAIQKRWKEEAVRIIEEDPYRIYYEIPRAGFITVDKAAMKAGIAKDDPRRLAAAVEQVCRDWEMQGHTYIFEPDFEKGLTKLLGIADLAQRAIKAGTEKGRAIYYFEESILQRSALGKAEGTIAAFVQHEALHAMDLAESKAGAAFDRAMEEESSQWEFLDD
jgi:exodeoxyribonuclease V alpha subunit